MGNSVIGVSSKAATGEFVMLD